MRRRGPLSAHQVEEFFLDDLAAFGSEEPDLVQLRSFAAVLRSDIHVEVHDELVLAMADEGSDGLNFLWISKILRGFK